MQIQWQGQALSQMLILWTDKKGNSTHAGENALDLQCKEWQPKCLDSIVYMDLRFLHTAPAQSTYCWKGPNPIPSPSPIPSPQGLERLSKGKKEENFHMKDGSGWQQWAGEQKQRSNAREHEGKVTAGIWGKWGGTKPHIRTVAGKQSRCQPLWGSSPQRRHLRRALLSLPPTLQGAVVRGCGWGAHSAPSRSQFHRLLNPRRHVLAQAGTVTEPPGRDLVRRKKCFCSLVACVTGVFLTSPLSAHGQWPQHRGQCGKSCKQAVCKGQPGQWHGASATKLKVLGLHLGERW